MVEIHFKVKVRLLGIIEHQTLTLKNLVNSVDTLEGGHIVCPGDWIITGVFDEHYPCKPDIFEATYEEV